MVDYNTDFARIDVVLALYHIDFGQNWCCIVQYNIDLNRIDVVFCIFFYILSIS